MTDGKAINVESYCLQMASLKNTHVVLLQDEDPLGLVMKENINWEEPFNELFTQNSPIMTSESHKFLSNFISIFASPN